MCYATDSQRLPQLVYQMLSLFINKHTEVVEVKMKAKFGSITNLKQITYPVRLTFPHLKN